MTININELRRLAQAATPGPWVAKNVSGAGLEIHMIHPLYPDKEWPAFGTDSAFCKKGLVSYETWTQFPHEVQNVQQSKNAEYIAAANPAVINELLDRLEAAEKSDAESIAMYRKARDERDTLRAKIETAEKAVTEAYQRGYATGQEEIEKELAELRSSMKFRTSLIGRAEAERDALRAKLAEIEQQEPVEWQCRSRPSWGDRQWSNWKSCSSGYAQDITKSPTLHDWQYEARPLYALPGAKTQGEEK